MKEYISPHIKFELLEPNDFMVGSGQETTHEQLAKPGIFDESDIDAPLENEQNVFDGYDFTINDADY